MESKIRFIRATVMLTVSLAACWEPPLGRAQEQSAPPQKQEEGPQLKFQRTVKSREYQGKQVEGEERVIAPGDSLWKILVQEKGVPEKRFPRAVVIIGQLNPQVKNPSALQVGETLFIPIRPDEILGITISREAKGEARIYLVKRGDHLYQILRDQLGTKDGPQMQDTFKQVQELNPKKKNWDMLLIGEGILLPGRPPTPQVAAAEKKKPSPRTVERVPPAVQSAKPDSPERPAQKPQVAAAESKKPAPQAAEQPPSIPIVKPDSAERLPLQENVALLAQVLSALGAELDRVGEEVVSLPEGTVRIERSAFPVIQTEKSGRKVILDPKGEMPAALKNKLEKDSPNVKVVSMKQGTSLRDAVNDLLSILGFQALPTDRPIVIQDGGVGVAAKGDWMATRQEESAGQPQVLVINLVDASTQTPDYMKDYLSTKGLTLKEIPLSDTATSTSNNPSSQKESAASAASETWPPQKGAMIDAFFRLYGISSSTARHVALPLREGIVLEVVMDRFFEFDGKKFALFFHSVGDDVKKVLQATQQTTTVELNLQAASRELIAKLLELVGRTTPYKQQRIPASGDKGKDKLVLTVGGFLLEKGSLLLTDGEIPKGLERFFAEKGIKVVYFR